MSSAAAAQGPGHAASRGVWAAGLALALAAVAVLAALAWRERAELMRVQQSRLELLVRVLEDHATRGVEAVSGATAALAEVAQRGAAPDSPSMIAALQQTLVHLPYLQGLAWLDANGKVLASTDPADLGARVPLDLLGPLPPAGSDALGAFVSSQRFQVLALSTSGQPAPAGAGFLPMVRTLAGPAGAPAGGPQVVLALLNPQAFAGFQELTLEDPTTAAVLATLAGSVWAGTASSGLSPGQDISRLPVMAEVVPRGGHGSWVGPGLRQGTQVGAYRALRSRPLVVMVELAESEVLGRWWRKVAGLLLAGSVGVLFILGSTALAARSMSRQECARVPGDQAQDDQAQDDQAQGEQARATASRLDQAPRAAALQGSAADPMELRAAQAELQSQLAFTESLVEGNPLPISVLDVQGRYLRVNRAWEVFSGRSRGEVIGTLAAATLPAPEAAVHDARDRELLASGTEVRYEVQHRLGDGSTRDLLVSKSLVRDGQGRAAGIVVALMDISDMREAERATRQARDVAMQASLAKSEFLANVSHELRTPLQSILGFSEIGRRRTKAQEALSGMFDDIHRAGKRMLALVNDLLDLARAESGELSMSFEFLDIRGLVREVCRELRPLVDERTLTLTLDLPREPLVASADALRFQQVVRNVLANAIRLSPMSGRIDVVLAQDQVGGVVLTVADRGPGIPEDELESIFGAFLQSSRTKDGSGGTGLGLAISRRIMQAHGGVISATLRDGGGSVFRVWLPGRDAAPPVFFD